MLTIECNEVDEKERERDDGERPRKQNKLISRHKAEAFLGRDANEGKSLEDSTEVVQAAPVGKNVSEVAAQNTEFDEAGRGLQRNRGNGSLLQQLTN